MVFAIAAQGAGQLKVDRKVNHTTNKKEMTAEQKVVKATDGDESLVSHENKTKAQILSLVPAVPADPTADDWYDCGDESGYSKFYFTLPETDVDGNQIDCEHLSYRVYTDNNQLFTFSAQDYTFDLDDEDIDEVPYWLYSNAVDFHDYYCYIYRTNESDYEPFFKERVGIQVIYTIDGVRNTSNIVYWPDNFVVPETIKATGVVVDKVGNPLEGATVTFTPVVAQEQSEGMPRRAEVGVVTETTDENGQFKAVLASLTDYNVTAALGNASITLDISTVNVDIDLEEIVIATIVTGIDDVTANKQVASTTYFDLTGRKVNEPVDGVFVKSIRYTDGTVTNVKVVK